MGDPNCLHCHNELCCVRKSVWGVVSETNREKLHETLQYAWHSLDDRKFARLVSLYDDELLNDYNLNYPWHVQDIKSMHLMFMDETYTQTDDHPHQIDSIFCHRQCFPNVVYRVDENRDHLAEIKCILMIHCGLLADLANIIVYDCLGDCFWLVEVDYSSLQQDDHFVCKQCAEYYASQQSHQNFYILDND